MSRQSCSRCNPTSITIRGAMAVNIRNPRQLRVSYLIMLADIRVFLCTSSLFPKPTHASIIKQPIISADGKSNAGIVNALAPSKNGTGKSHVSHSTRLQLDGENLRRFGSTES